MTTSEDEKELRVDRILERAETIAFASKLVGTKAAWLLVRREVVRILSDLRPWELEDSKWADDDILSVLECVNSYVWLIPPPGVPTEPPPEPSIIDDPQSIKPEWPEGWINPDQFILRF